MRWVALILLALLIAIPTGALSDEEPSRALDEEPSAVLSEGPSAALDEEPSGLPGEDHSGSESPFPMPSGLEGMVEFWKSVFTQYGRSQLIFFDPLEPAKIYNILEIKDGKKPRQLMSRERRKIISAYKVDEKRVSVQRGVKERFAEGLGRSGRYIQQMQQIFVQEGLPAELAYLPLIESSFKLGVRSSAGAVGVWQFMPSTGRRFLRVGRLIDERRDPLESTRAAARFLKENYEALGNWPLAITSYNHGQGGVSRAVATVGSRDLGEIIRKYRGRRFGFASKNFYAEFLAAVEVARNAEEYFPDLEYHPPVPFHEIEVEKPTPLRVLIHSAGVSQKEFLEWNPALKPGIRVIPKGYRVKVPAEEHQPLMEAYTTAADGSLVRHRVAAGETLSHIARIYQTSVSELQEINQLPGVHMLNIGQLLLIPKP